MTGKDKPKIVIVGPGATGLVLAAVLSQKNTVWLLGRSAPEAAHNVISFTLSGDINVSASLPLLNSPDKISEIEPDHIIYALKAYNLRESFESTSRFIPANTSVVITSNGLGIFHLAKDLFPVNQSVIRLLLSFGAFKLEPHTVKVSGELKASLACLATDAEGAKKLCTTLTQSGFSCTQEESVKLAEWKKLLVNMAVNPICALAGTTNGAVIENSHLRELAFAALDEVRRVALKEGVNLFESDNANILDSITKHSANLNSMLIDLKNKKQTEIDFIAGKLIEIANKHSVSVPVTKTLHSLIKAIEMKVTS